jgi:hypothetical protein
MGKRIHIFLISELVEGEWSPSRPDRFTPEERTPGTHWIGGWMGPRTGLADMEKLKFFPPPGLKLRPLGRPACSQLTGQVGLECSWLVFERCWVRISALSHDILIEISCRFPQSLQPNSGIVGLPGLENGLFFKFFQFIISSDPTIRSYITQCRNVLCNSQNTHSLLI